MSNKIAILGTLRQDLIAFLDEVIEVLPHEKELVVMKAFAKVVIISDVADYIADNLCPLEDKVKKRDEAYFIENAVMFEKLQDRASTVNHFKTLWETTDDPENKLMVWEWLHHFIKLVRKYKEYGC